MSELRGEPPHEPQGLYDDEPWISFSLLRIEMDSEADNEMLGRYPIIDDFIKRVMRRLWEFAREETDHE